MYYFIECSWNDSISDMQLLATAEAMEGPSIAENDDIWHNCSLTDSQLLSAVNTIKANHTTATEDDDCVITEVEFPRIDAEAEEEVLKQKRLIRGKQPCMYSNIYKYHFTRLRPVFHRHKVLW